VAEPRVRALRKQKKLSVEALATSAGIHKGHLSRIERGEKSPSLRTLAAIAKALGADMAQLFGERTAEDEVRVGRKAARVVVDRTSPYKIEVVLPRCDTCPLTVSVVSPTEQFQEQIPEHSGHELLFVLEGAVELIVGERTFSLETGECASYDAALRHKFRSTKKDKTKVLIVIASANG
jgi:transcriptional regulator with XRE-family HTH domain